MAAMPNMRLPLRAAIIAGWVGALLCSSSEARAVGESVNGFPNWGERVMLEWTNRARVDPQLEMAKCGSKCGEGSCYTPAPPYVWNEHLNHAARFHSDEQNQQAYFAHDSACAVVANIDSLYPSTCNGAASCACTGGTKTCGSGCTTWSDRVALFGIGPNAEVIAGVSEPDAAFYGLLFESFSGTQCGVTVGPPTNGHRWQLLAGTGQVGFGSTAGPTVGDFAGGGTITPIPSVAHYPRQSAAVAVWANWYSASAPVEALVNVDGSCTPLTLARGTTTNGAYTTTLGSNVASGCHRYVVRFKSAAGTFTYPTTGSLGIGPAGSCADWDATSPAFGAGCSGGGATDAGASDAGPTDAGPTDAGGSNGDSGTKTDAGGSDSGTSADASATDGAASDSGTSGNASSGGTGSPDGATSSTSGQPPSSSNAGGSGGSAGRDASTNDNAEDDSSGGCDCNTTEGPSPSLAVIALAAVTFLVTRRRSRR